MTQNQIAYQAHLENKRANEAREAETHRSNTVNEKENERFHSASLAETRRSNIARETETNRSNLAKEIETNRANVARETETNRSNLATEMLKATDIRVRSEDSRYATDVGYQGRIDSAYINQWGVSPTDLSSLASSIGKGVKTAAPGAKGVAKAGLDMASSTAIKAATAPVRAVVDTAKRVQDVTKKYIAPQNKSTNKTNSSIGGRTNGRKKKQNLQKH